MSTEATIAFLEREKKNLQSVARMWSRDSLYYQGLGNDREAWIALHNSWDSRDLAEAFEAVVTHLKKCDELLNESYELWKVKQEYGF